MEHEEKIRLLLHPEQYSDEQLQQMLADDPELTELLEQMALTKQAFVKREADEEAAAVDDEWEKFYAAHSAEIDATDDAETKRPLIVRLAGYIPYKLAASFIGILLTVGVAFAAVHIVQMTNSDKQQTAQADQPASAMPDKALPADTLATDTTAAARRIVFDNTPLEKMLPQIAAYYHKEVEFMNADARQLRFYFVWKPEEGLEVTLHRINLFESVNIEQNDNRIVVR